MVIHSATTIRQPVSKVQRFWTHSWWVVVFMALCGAIYLHAMKQKEVSYQEMVSRLKRLEHDKTLAKAQREELLLQIHSQSDPAWVEMVLKRNLGMVPEGQKKVYFER